MLQIIGWMGCVYLFVKGFEFVAHNGYRNENGGIKASALIAVCLAWFSAIALFALVSIQGLDGSSLSGSMGTESAPSIDRPDKSEAWHECVRDAKDGEEAVKCSEID